MDTYLLVHRHPRNYSGSPGAAAAWEVWFDKLGDALWPRAIPSWMTTAPLVGPAPFFRWAATRSSTRPILKRPLNWHMDARALQAGGAVEVGRLTPSLGRQHPARTFG